MTFGAPDQYGTDVNMNSYISFPTIKRMSPSQLHWWRRDLLEVSSLLGESDTIHLICKGVNMAKH